MLDLDTVHFLEYNLARESEKLRSFPRHIILWYRFGVSFLTFFLQILDFLFCFTFECHLFYSLFCAV